MKAKTFLGIIKILSWILKGMCTVRNLLPSTMLFTFIQIVIALGITTALSFDLKQNDNFLSLFLIVYVGTLIFSTGKERRFHMWLRAGVDTFQNKK